ncbi:MAG: hypothetical protein ACXWF8_13305 [Methylobacter sp.]
MDNRLFEIRLFHQYYDDGVMQNIRLQPDHATQAFLDRYRLIARQTPGIYALHYFGSSTASTFTQALNQLLNGRPLVFNLLNNDNGFAVFTDLPIDWCGQLEYSSQNTEPDASETPDRNTSQTIKLATQLRPRNAASTSVIGQVAIYPQDLLTDTGEMRRPMFAIKMKARLTHWRYYVFNRSQIKLTHPVINNAQGIEFEPPEPVTLENGEQALLFSSGERTFALSETIKSPFNLINFITNFPDQPQQARSNAKKLIAGLPIPKTDTLMIEMRNGHQYVYSPMYVYL